MTVEELINELKKYPGDMLVTDGCGRIEEVMVIEEYYDGDAANPNCPCYRALRLI